MGAGGADIKLCERLNAEMLVELARIGDYPDDETGWVGHLRCAMGKISELKAAFTGEFADDREEIFYFRELWPRLHGQYFYYHLLQIFWVKQECHPASDRERLLKHEEKVAVRFFERNDDFWLKYRCGVGYGDAFTRGYSKGSLLDPLSVIADIPKASYLAARGLAYESYLKWLNFERGMASGGDRVEWKENLSDAVELIKSQVEAGSIFINGKPATAKQLRADFEQRYNIRLRNFDNLLYAKDTVKIDETVYLSKLIKAFKGRKKGSGNG